MARSTVDTSLIDDEIFEWGGREYTQAEFSRMVSDADAVINGTGVANDDSKFTSIANSITGIFGLPYQFSTIVDVPVVATGNIKIGRKYTDRVLSTAPILFLSPGEPAFMEGYSAKAKKSLAGKIAGILDNGSDPDDGGEFDDGRYYTFQSDFPEYKKYANVALRALALYMGIGEVEIPVPGSNGRLQKLKNIDVEKFLNSNFAKLFGSQVVVPFYVDAESQINESFSNNTTESMLSQTVNGFSQTAREVQFIMGSKDYGGVLNSIGSSLTDVAANTTAAFGDLAEVMAGKNLLSRVANELTTIVSGGKIIFPEIWSDSSYDRSYDVTIKLRSPDPDPVSIFLNIYMPLVLLITMASPRQIGNSSNSYESPFLVRATYKSIFSCDLGIISSLSITRGMEDVGWNAMGQCTSADVTLSLKDLYSSMFVSKRMGLLCNTAQMDYLATMAGVDLNEFEPERMLKLAAMILGDTPRDWATDLWGGIKRTLNIKSAKLLSNFTDTRFLGY